MLLTAEGKIKVFYWLCGGFDFPETFFSPSFSSFSFFGRILCVLKTFCSGELCTSYSWQLRSHLWSWMRSLVHILFYLCLWSGFLWFFLRLCFYSKDIQPTISKKEKEVKFILSIRHCLFRHMDKLDYVPLNVFFQYANNLCFSAVITVKSSTIRWIATQLIKFSSTILQSCYCICHRRIKSIFQRYGLWYS